MPIYEYQCEECGHRMEAIQKLSDKPFTECPECGGQLKKLISSPAFQFKGTGWYVTDYAGKKDGGTAGGSSGDSSSDGGSTSSSDAGSKSSTKSEGKTSADSGSASGSSAAGD